MTKKDDHSTGDRKDITLRDVVVHMQHMEQKLSSNIKDAEQRLTKRIDANTVAITENTSAIQVLGERIDALDEDLTATI